MPRRGEQPRSMPPRRASLEPAVLIPPPGADDLLIAAGRGDRDAFAVFYDRTAAAVFGLLRSVLLDDAATESATRRVYLHLWRNAARFDPAGRSAYSLLLAIARRELTGRVWELVTPAPAVVPPSRRTGE